MTDRNVKPMPLTPEYIFGLILRRYWLVLIPFCIAVVTGIILSAKLPRTYQATTLILVEPQRVPQNYVQSVIPVGIEGRISTLSQQIMSRTNLEKVIEQFKIYSETDQEKLFMEEKVADMRKRIIVDVMKHATNKDTDAFSISFTGKDPQKVMQVTNALATFFIDENLKSREASAVGTSTFLFDELSGMRDRLSELESALKDYRQKNMGALPEQLESNLRILDRLQAQLTDRQLSLREARDKLAMVERQMSEAETIRQQVITSETGTPVVQEVSRAKELEMLKNQLESMKSKYTDQHPDVIRMKSRIAQLETELEEKEKKEASENATASPPTPVKSLRCPTISGFLPCSTRPCKRKSPPWSSRSKN